MAISFKSRARRTVGPARTTRSPACPEWAGLSESGKGDFGKHDPAPGFSERKHRNRVLFFSLKRACQMCGTLLIAYSTWTSHGAADYRTNFGSFPSHSRSNGVSLPATPRQRCVGLAPAGVGLNGAIGPAAVTHGCQGVYPLLGVVDRRFRRSSGCWITERATRSDIIPQD
jgi:hypothetical protein